MPDDTSHIAALFCLAVSGTNLFAGTGTGNGGGGVFLSTNNGTSWTAASTGLMNIEVHALAVSGRNLFAGTGSWKTPGGVYLSTNNGTSWTAVDSGLTGSVVNALAVSGGNLFAGTSGGGVWTRPWVWKRELVQMVTSVEPATSEVPRQFRLAQNYPNPFNPSTIIKFELPKTSQVSLTVYDVLGRQVAVLVNERREAGVYEVKFDGSGLSSGVYFYRLTAGSFVQTHKLLLMR